MHAKSILQKKGNVIYHIQPGETVFEAIRLMSEKRIGALLVMEEERLVGIISERDYRDKVILKGRTSKTTRVDEIMTSDLLCVSPSETVQECMAIMTEEKIRHLPVLQNDTVVGVISIGDLVKEIISEQKIEIHHLKRYIVGSYPA